MLSSNLNKVGVVILAAGKGTRLNCLDKPKVMLEIGHRPIISYAVKTLKQIGFTKEQIVFVVGFKKEQIMDFFKDEVSYAVQEEQLGTGHAAYIGIKSLPNYIEHVLVMGGDDGAFYKAETISDFIEKHINSNCTASLVSAILSDPASFGRIVRGENRIEIVEKEYVNEQQKQIHEINTGTYIFNRKWFDEMFLTMPKMSKLGEYGINPAFTIAQDKGKNIHVFQLRDNNEWFGINTLSELEEANRRKNNS
jgi:bifunctional UDP-N-acetylglucosamine pyrophosphorylase/glucosamine-1-phosphate N-acetyltransferase